MLSAVEEAMSARLLLEIPGAAARYRFAHALVRDTLYDQQSAARRVGLHRRVAQEIEELHATDLDDHLPGLAHHWARGAVQAAETARAIDYAVRAGDRALAQLAADEAAADYRDALELRDVSGSATDLDHCRLLIALGEAQRRAGDPAHRETLLDASRLADGLQDPALLTAAVLDLTIIPVFPALFAWACAEAGQTEEAEAVLAQARQADFGGLRYDYLWLGTLVFVSRACARLGDASNAKEIYERLRPHHGAFAIGQAVWLGPVAYDLGLLATVLERYDDADAHFTDAVEAHHRIGARGMLAHTHLDWARMLFRRKSPGDMERAKEQLRQAEQTARQLGLNNIEEEATALLRDLS